MMKAEVPRSYNQNTCTYLFEAQQSFSDKSYDIWKINQGKRLFYDFKFEP